MAAVVLDVLTEVDVFVEQEENSHAVVWVGMKETDVACAVACMEVMVSLLVAAIGVFAENVSETVFFEDAAVVGGAVWEMTGAEVSVVAAMEEKKLVSLAKELVECVVVCAVLTE